MITKIEIDNSSDNIKVDVTMTRQQMTDFRKGLDYLLEGGKNLYLQDERTIVRITERTDLDDRGCKK